MINDNKLAFWIENNLNVLFIGKHGVGKTSVIKDAFEKANLNWKYFSTATMDPWVDFIGVPKSVKDGDTEYLELVRPKEFADDKIEAIFFDEFNRSPKKVRNAVMELIQFKSINGKKFNNLRIVWAAVNPDDEEKYDVEKIDEAQLDRFHIHVEVPYKCNSSYFSNKYGKDIASAAISWWDELPLNQKEKVSPRRLDYALMMNSISGNIRDVLPGSSNISKLITVMQFGPVKKTLQRLIKESNAVEAKSFLLLENNYSSSIDHIIKNDEYMKFFFPVMSPEKLASLLTTNKKAFDFITQNVNIDVFAKIVEDVYTVSKKATLKNKIKKVCKGITDLPENIKNMFKAIPKSNVDNLFSVIGVSGIFKRNFNAVKPAWGAHTTSKDKYSNKTWTSFLNDMLFGNTIERRISFRKIQEKLPKSFNSSQEAIDTLKALDTIFKKSHEYTITRILFQGKIVNLSNHCCAEAERLMIIEDNLSVTNGLLTVDRDIMSVIVEASININDKLRDIGKDELFWWVKT